MDNSRTGRGLNATQSKNGRYNQTIICGEDGQTWWIFGSTRVQNVIAERISRTY